MSAEFMAAYAFGSLAQAALVVGAGALALPLRLRALRHWAFAVIPLASLVGVVAALRVRPEWATAIAQVALVAVPLLALAAAAHVGVPALAATVLAVVAVLHDSDSLVGQLAALHLIGASCLLLAALLVQLTPERWLGIGIVAMAAVDLVLVAGGVLGPASDALNAAAVSERLPRLQRVELGPLRLGYGDMFLPALVGALLARRARPLAWAAGLTLVLALVAGLAFLAFSRLPATVPVALALLVVEAVGAGRVVWRRRRPSAAPTARPPETPPFERAPERPATALGATAPGLAGEPARAATEALAASLAGERGRGAPRTTRRDGCPGARSAAPGRRAAPSGRRGPVR